MKYGKGWFMRELPDMFSDIHSKGEACEQFYDEKSFPFGFDLDSNI